MHRLLVALHDGVVPILVVRGVVTPRLVLIEAPEQAVGEALLADLLDQRRDVLRHEEGELPCVAFDVVLVGAAAEGIEVFEPLALAVAHVAVSLVADDVAPPVAAVVERAVGLFVAERLGLVR